MNIAKLKNKAEGLVTQMTAKDECEKRVLDAISNNKYAAPRSLLNEVAEDTFSHDSYSSVMRLVWKTIESPPRNWRSIAKALILLDHLVKNGAEKVVSDVQQHIHDITYLNEFRYMEGHLDRGSGVREKAQDLAALVRNPDRIHAERRKAKDLRSQYSGYGADVPPRLSSGSGGGGSGGGGSARDFPSSAPRNTYAGRGGTGGGGQGRDSGEISDDWTAGYDRSPTPPPIEARRVIGRGGSGGRSQSIDFDEGREGYSGRLSQYQEQEKREASLASQPRRGSRDSSEGKGAMERRTGSGSNKGAASSKKRTDSKKSSGPEPSAPAGHDLLSGDDPFPVAAPSRPENDFSSFASFAAPQMLQGGAPVASGGWTGGGGMPQPQQQQQQQQQQQPQWTAPLSAQTGQLVPYEQGAPGPGVQQQQQQQPMQMQHGMQPQAQTGWGQQTIQGQQGGYGQGQGAQYAAQQGMRFTAQQQQYGQPQQQQQQQQQYGQPQQQQYGQPQQQQTQPQQQQMYPQYQQQQQQQQPAQPQQGYQTPQQPQHQQQQPFQQQPQQPYQQQQQQPYQQQHQPQQSYRQEQQPIPDPQQPFQPQPPQQQQGQLPQQTPQPPPAHHLQQPQAPHSQAQQSQPLALPVHTQQPPAGAQQTDPAAPAAPQQQQQQQHFVGSDSSQPRGPDTNANTAEKDWVATEVVRAGIGGIDLAAAVGGLRQTGFKPSDVGGGKTEFSGQGLRGSDGRHVGAPPQTQQRAAYPAPPQPSVEYVEADQEGQEVVVQASTREFLGARSGLKNTGLSTRLQETPQQQVPNPAVVASPAPTPSYQGLPQASGGGGTGAGAGAGQQWQGLPQQQGHGRAGGVQTPSWQTRQGGLRSTGLMASGGSGPEQVGGAGQVQGSAPAAPWQQGTAGLRRTGL